MAEVTETNYLNVDQMARFQALLASRQCLSTKTAFGEGKPDAVDLIALAEYIGTGADPYRPQDSVHANHAVIAVNEYTPVELIGHLADAKSHTGEYRKVDNAD